MGETMKKSKKYKSPQRKLVIFFEKSRDNWKVKCREAKIMIKRLKNRVRFLEHSKENWKSKAKEFESKVKKLEDELERIKIKLDYQVFSLYSYRI